VSHESPRGESISIPKREDLGGTVEEMRITFVGLEIRAFGFGVSSCGLGGVYNVLFVAFPFPDLCNE
jgi:hypothetical protein